jgi:hypothetical protein
MHGTCPLQLRIDFEKAKHLEFLVDGMTAFNHQGILRQPTTTICDVFMF